MIGSGLKKLAATHNMSVANGVAYGSLMGYATTLSEGSGYKLLEVSTSFTEATQKEGFYSAVHAVDFSRVYRVQKLEIGAKRITVVFTDTVGTMKKVEEFVAWFYPLLAQYGATNASICAECGGDAAAGGWYFVNGIVHRFHDSCAEHLKNEINGEKEEQRQQDNGSYVQGFFGALGGALIGAIVWAFIYSFGYVAALVGLLMGWLAEKGYNLLHGKQGKGKVVILIIVIILGVIIGNIGGEAIKLVNDFNAGNWEGFVYGDIPFIILDNILYNPDYVSYIIGNIVMGLLFAGLGVFMLIKNTAKEVSDVKFKKLS